MRDMTAADLVAHRVCTAMCLIAAGREATACSCVCEGRWHGVCSDWQVAGSAECRQPLEPGQPGPDLLDLLAPTGRT